MTWPIIFLLVVLKIPVAYLCAVVWWAIRAEPRPEEPAALVGTGGDAPDRPAWSRAGRLRPQPPRGPIRRPAARRAPAFSGARR